MCRIAIVDDEPTSIQSITCALERFEADHACTFSVEAFTDPLGFLDRYSSRFDLIVLDIQMPLVNGMELAEHIRSLDADVPLVFVTNLASMATRGYEVEASGFIVKPIRYGAFEATLNRALRKRDKAEEAIILKTANGLARVSASSIVYLEVVGHRVVYHTPEADFTTWSSLRAEREKLPQHLFAQCSAYAIVNLSRVTEVTATEVRLGSESVSLSRSRRKEFNARVLAYYGREA